MIYKSNLEAPDLSRHFRLLSPSLQILGHDAPSDPDYEPACTYWTHDELAILYASASTMLNGRWIDIGSRFGWTAAGCAWAGQRVTLVDPHFVLAARVARMEQNLECCWIRVDEVIALPWQEAATRLSGKYDGFIIDGNHDAPEPLKDAQSCAKLAADTAVILMHDLWGGPIRAAVRWLISQGWSARCYFTPNGVAVCWRGDFTPPDHERDPAIDWRGHEMMVYSDIAALEWA